MKLIVPSASAIHPADHRLVRLAEWLGIECRVVPFERGELIQCLSAVAAQNADAVLLINGAVIVPALDENGVQALTEVVRSGFRRAFVHQLPDGAKGEAVLRTLSRGCLYALDSVRPLDVYEVASNVEDVCGAFSGLSFGPVVGARDRIMAAATTAACDAIISIGENALLARVRNGGNETFFFAGREISDLSAPVADSSLSVHFSQLFPAIMFLQYSFGLTCWRPGASTACLIIDDPPLWSRYGFLDYADLMSMMDRHNFHTSVAFIPYYFRKSQPAVSRLFLERNDRLSLCYHGNDHTSAELGSKAVADLNGLLATAVARMEDHLNRTKVPCHKVMVFPQGKFSSEAMVALRASNFTAAVNSDYAPMKGDCSLSLEEFLNPAVMRHHQFPLFLRRYPSAINVPEIAANLFLGKPVLIVEHHDAFKDPQVLLASIETVNRIAPTVEWTNLRVATESAFRWRPIGPDAFEVQAFSNSVMLTNKSDGPCSFSVCWRKAVGAEPEKVIASDGRTIVPRLEAGVIGAAVTVEAGQSIRVQVLYRNNLAISTSHQKLKHVTRVFFRRRLSEFRDHYLSRYPTVLSLAKSAQKRLRAPRESTGPNS